MAMRISSVSPALAKEKAEEAVSDVIGVMTSASDAAYSKYNDGMNPYYRVTSSWNEIRISANITSYLSGYNDPRLAKYASEADASIGGGQIGSAKWYLPKCYNSGKLYKILPPEYWYR